MNLNQKYLIDPERNLDHVPDAKIEDIFNSIEKLWEK